MLTGDCVLWDGRVGDHGYGMQSRRLAHRMAWEETHGPIPPGMQVHHRCEIKLCINPQHLELMSVADHARHHGPTAAFLALVEERRSRTHCPKGHEYTPENTILKQGKRHCRECAKAYSREWHQRNRERVLPEMRERERLRRLRKKQESLA